MLEFTQRQQKSALDFNLQKKTILMHKRKVAEAEQMVTKWLEFFIELDSDFNLIPVRSMNYERVFTVAKSFQRIAKLISYAFFFITIELFKVLI